MRSLSFLLWSLTAVLFVAAPDTRAQENPDEGTESDSGAPAAEVALELPPAPEDDDGNEPIGGEGDDDTGEGETEDAEEEIDLTPKKSDEVKAEEETWSDRVIDDGIDRLKRPVDRLVERTLGSASRPVGFDWRKSWFMLGATGSELIERNNYGSFRLGIMGRKAFGDFMFEGAVNYVTVITTPSSRALSLTPYVQAGRKERFEVDVNVSYPLVEGVVTPLFDVFPPLEMVLSATASGRYLIYPRAIVGDRDWGRASTYTNTQTWIDLGGSLASPTLTDADQEVLDPYVPAGMLLDPARIQALVGFTFDIYMQPGVFISTRAVLGLPVLAAVTQTQLGLWPELSIALGYAF